jgi:hypothetical protein
MLKWNQKIPNLFIYYITSQKIKYTNKNINKYNQNSEVTHSTVVEGFMKKYNISYKLNTFNKYPKKVRRGLGYLQALF